MKAFAFAFCILTSSCATVIPVLEKGAEELVEDVAKVGIDEAVVYEVRKELVKLAIAGFCAFSICYALRKGLSNGRKVDSISNQVAKQGQVA